MIKQFTRAAMLLAATCFIFNSTVEAKSSDKQKKIREAPKAVSLFDGKTLKGWKTVKKITCPSGRSLMVLLPVVTVNIKYLKTLIFVQRKSTKILNFAASSVFLEIIKAALSMRVFNTVLYLNTVKSLAIKQTSAKVTGVIFGMNTAVNIWSGILKET